MAIVMTSGGVSKTYRYFPYDALYVDASGNLNANGNGSQVREAWFDGVKYYPDGQVELFGQRFLQCYQGRLYYQGSYYNLGLVKYSYAWVFGYNPSWFYKKIHHNYGWKFLDAKYYSDNNRNRYSSVHILVNAQIDFEPLVISEPINRATSKFHRSLFNDESKRIFDALMNGMQFEFNGTDISVRDGYGWEGPNPLISNFSNDISTNLIPTIPSIRFDFYDENDSYLNGMLFVDYGGGTTTSTAIRYNGGDGSRKTDYRIDNFEPSGLKVLPSDLIPLPS